MEEILLHATQNSKGGSLVWLDPGASLRSTKPVCFLSLWGLLPLQTGLRKLLFSMQQILCSSSGWIPCNS